LSEQTQQPGRIDASFRKAGATPEAEVEVNISYDIIRHVSAQLYTNPRKAIEELVCNSYDAGAGECWVTLPRNPEEPLLILDNGMSMDVAGLKNLWKVAWSPKVKNGEPRVENNRLQIGKFGVGKLAAFALGGRLTHVACVNEKVRVVSVGQSEIKEQKGGARPTFAVYMMPLEKAKQLLAPLLANLPKPWERSWKTWTLALIEEIETQVVGRALKVGFLKQMIASALPVSSDFKVFLERELVPKREITPEQIEVKIDVTDPQLQERIEETLQAYGQRILGKEKIEDVPPSYYKLRVEEVPNPQRVSETISALVIPKLGPVIGSAIIAKESLTTHKLEERGYSNNGFAIYSHGKLVNPEDELFGVTQRALGFWTRFLARLEMPDLDEVLLVQRNQVSENSDQAQIAREVIRTIFNFARNKAEELEGKEAYEPENFGARLRMLAPILAPLALRGLAKEGFPKDGLNSLSVGFATLGENGPVARYAPEERKILVNEDHPLIAALDDIGPKSKPLRHVIGEVIAGTQMAKGYLEASGISEAIVQETIEILEVALLSAASFVRDEVEEYIKEIREASYEGGAPFENAVVRGFRGLRLAATHLGDAGEPDGIISIPRSGQPVLRISVEAKGSKGIITHKQLSEATVSRHRRDQGCTNAIAIAREYQTEGRRGDDSALLAETRDKVPLITVEGIEKMLRLHRKRPFTYDAIVKILTTWKSPTELVAFVDQTWRELPDLGLMKLILTVAHELIQRDEVNYPDPGMILADLRVQKRKVQRSQVISVLQAIQVTTQMIIIRNTQDYQFELLAPPDTIIEALSFPPEDNT